MVAEKYLETLLDGSNQVLLWSRIETPLACTSPVPGYMAIVTQVRRELPVLISVTVFAFYSLTTFPTVYMPVNRIVYPTCASWSADLICSPIAIILLYSATNDSPLFTLKKYSAPIIQY